MRSAEEIKKLMKNIPIHTSRQRDDEVLDEVLNALETSKKTRSAGIEPSVWRIIMTSKASKFIAAMIVVGIVVSFFASEKLISPTWALEDAIEALKGYGAVHVVGAFPGGTAEIWMRANEARTHSTDVVVKGSHGAITWSQDGSTYHYEPSLNTIYYEEALTIGLAQWLGPELLEMLSVADKAEVVRGKDPVTGRGRVMLICSMIDVHGPQSWIIEFDMASKLPVAFKQWQNMDRNGPPSFDAFKVTYYEDLPDSLFDVSIPGDPMYVEKDLTIPDETLGSLSNPKHGLSTEGMTQQEAAEKAVRTMYQALIDLDLDQLKNICPLCNNWGDEFLRKVILRPDKEDHIAEIVEIGQISKTGHSKLGPIVAVPTVYRRENGTKVAQKMIVQFRDFGGKSSCVVHGPYGLPRELE
ncbi:MAG: hypothetical protein JXM79_19950 [Sedimentisphaerales bacterium]|nr:hypothetical protein [Sedimentisphaerales bacterium]